MTSIVIAKGVVLGWFIITAIKWTWFLFLGTLAAINKRNIRSTKGGPDAGLH